MRRRSFLRGGLGFSGASLAATLAGCGGRNGGRGTTRSDLDPAELTTTGGDDVVILVAQVVIREREDGPRIYYRLRNDAETDATVEIRTVLSIEDGGTYEASGFVDVPAGGEMFVEYPIVRYEELSAAEEAAVRRGGATFETYVNGERRQV